MKAILVGIFGAQTSILQWYCSRSACCSR